MNNTIKQVLVHSFTHSVTRTINLVRDMEATYLDAVQSRNDAPYQSKAYDNALVLIESIESEASRIVFGHHNASMTECLTEVDLMASDWEVGQNVFASSSINRPQAITKGTSAYRYRGAWVVLRFRIENGEPSLWFLHVPEWVVIPQYLGAWPRSSSKE